MKIPGLFFHNYDGGGGRFHASSRRWTTHKEFRRYVFHSPLPKIASVLLKSNKINLLYDKILQKSPKPLLPLLGTMTIPFGQFLEGKLYLFG